MKQLSEDAPIKAAMRADVMREKGDLGGYAVWKRGAKRPMSISRDGFVVIEQGAHRD